MANNDLYLGPDTGSLTLLSAFGRTYNIKNIELNRQERTASGRLVRDIIAKKKEFTLSYSMIDGNDLTTFDNFYALDSELIFRDVTTDYTVLIEPIDRTRILQIDDGLWGGVEVVLIEV